MRELKILASVLLFLMLLGPLVGFLFSPSTDTGAATVKALSVDSEHNVQVLEINIKGKSYYCRPTFDSFAQQLIHCEPESSGN